MENAAVPAVPGALALAKLLLVEMTGIHLHDVKGIDDHLAPGQGEMDYEEIRPFLKSYHIKILEVHSKVDREDLIDGIRFIKKTGLF